MTIRRGIRRTLFLGLILAASHGGIVLADVARPPIGRRGPPCTVDQLQNSTRECQACTGRTGEPERCERLLIDYAYARVCRVAVEDEWREVWCRAVGRDPLPPALVALLTASAPSPAPSLASDPSERFATPPPGRPAGGPPPPSGGSSAVPGFPPAPASAPAPGTAPLLAAPAAPAAGPAVPADRAVETSAGGGCATARTFGAGPLPLLLGVGLLALALDRRRRRSPRD